MHDSFYRLLLAGVLISCPACATKPNDKLLPYRDRVIFKDPTPQPVPSNGAIYQEQNHRALFSDLKAMRQGDLITVILDEQTNAAKNASTNASRSTGIDIAAPNIFNGGATFNGNPASVGISSGSDFSGGGDSTQSNSLFGNITARVTYIEPNGNLHIRGEKQLTLNSGLEIIQVSGVVRPADLTPDNTILSTLIADANIVYSGEGLIADNNRAGWLTRFFTSRFWPF